MVQLQTLGKLDLRGGSGETLPTVTARPREMALLIYLATAGPGALRRRDTVLALFWPETPEDRARHTLNQMLYGLRRALGDGVMVSRGQNEIGTSNDLLQCDATEFRQALEEKRWEDALAIYGGPFLPGFFVSRAPALERWIDEERQEHRRAARDAAIALSEQLEQKGDLRGATSWAKRAWEIEPASDSLLRRPLVLLHKLGERSEALVLFEGFRKRIANDYGLEPSAETLEIVATIRAESAGRASTSVDTSAGVVDGRGSLPTSSASPTGRGLGGTLAGAGAALVGVAAVSWALLAPGNSPTDLPIFDSPAPVVVVLPVVVSGSWSPEFGDLTGALTNALTDRLGEVPGLLVVPAESVEAQLEETADVVEIGRRLLGDAIIESSLDWKASGVETSARITDLGTGEVLWDASHSYPHNELLSAQLDLTVGLASALNVRLAPIPLRDLTFSSDEELIAWSLVSEARDTLAEGDPDAARALIQRAVALDPDYAPAYAAQAFWWTNKWSSRREEWRWLDSALVAAEHALSLDPDHFLSHLALAQAMNSARISNPQRYPPRVVRRGAEAALRAVQLNPNSPEASRMLRRFLGGPGHTLIWNERAFRLLGDWLSVQSTRAHNLWLLGDYDGAIEAHELATELDPRQPRPGAFRISEYNLSRGRLKEARSQIKDVREQDPENVMAYAVAIYLELMEQDYEAAEGLIEELLNRDPPVEVISTSNFFTRTALGYVYLKTGRSREGRRLLEVVRDGLLERLETGSGYVTHYNLARIYAMLDDPGQAIHWLQVAIDRGWPFYYTEMGRTDPMLENLLGNEEFERIMADLKAKLDAERAWAKEMLALPEPERFKRMLIDAEKRLETLWEAQGVL